MSGYMNTIDRNIILCYTVISMSEYVTYDSVHDYSMHAYKKGAFMEKMAHCLFSTK